MRGLARDQRGAIAIEYLAVVVASLVVVSAFSAMAVELARQYRHALTVMNSEYP